jgi:hypothetical protein
MYKRKKSENEMINFCGCPVRLVFFMQLSTSMSSYALSAKKRAREARKARELGDKRENEAL